MSFTCCLPVQISQDFESPLRPAEDTTLSELVTAGLFPFLERVEEVSLTATKEFALEQTLQRMQAEWNDIRFEYVPYRDSDLCVLTGVEEIQVLQAALVSCNNSDRRLIFLLLFCNDDRLWWTTTSCARRRCTRRRT